MSTYQILYHLNDTFQHTEGVAVAYYDGMTKVLKNLWNLKTNKNINRVKLRYCGYSEDNLRSFGNSRMDTHYSKWLELSICDISDIEELRNRIETTLMLNQLSL